MSIGRQDYQERKEARADRLEERAQAAAQKSDDAFRRSSSLVSGIPAGQPILPGARGAHHRRTLERSWDLMEKGVQSSHKADYLQGRADAIRENSAISGDDPEALEKLERKLAALQAAQDRDKAMNAYYRKKQQQIKTLSHIYSRYFFKKCPVWEAGHFATSSGVPATTISPPLTPPSGPRSII